MVESARTPLDSDEPADGMDRTTPPAAAPNWRVPALAGIAIALLVGVVFMVTRSTGNDGPDASAEPSATVGSAMAGPVADVVVSKEALASVPDSVDLSTPENAVRSYLDWSSYAYRTAQSSAAIPTMSTYQEVRVDAGIQGYIQKGCLLDMKVVSLTFREPREDAERVHVPVRESWEYSYVSISEPGKVISGPHEVTYEATYTVIPQGDDWVVDEVKSTALDTVVAPPDSSK